MPEEKLLAALTNTLSNKRLRTETYGTHVCQSLADLRLQNINGKVSLANCYEHEGCIRCITFEKLIQRDITKPNLFFNKEIFLHKSK